MSDGPTPGRRSAGEPPAFSDLVALQGRVADVYRDRCAAAAQTWFDTLGRAAQSWLDAARPLTPLQAWNDAARYWTDFPQRSLLFWDTLRQRGNTWLDHEAAGKPPLLAFAWEIVADGRTLARPVNYALVRITPPPGTRLDADKRPFVIIDPRAGHGPGIGGFKAESEVGVALKAGHPVYMVVFFPDPVDGQTLADVAQAEAEFLRLVRSRHATARQAGHRRQLPGRLGRHAGRCARSGLLRSHRGERRADVLLGRQRRRESDALRRRHARRKLDGAARRAISAAANSTEPISSKTSKSP